MERNGTKSNTTFCYNAYIVYSRVYHGVYVSIYIYIYIYIHESSLSLKRVLEILNTPDVERVSNMPAAKPKADEVYVFSYGTDHTKSGKQAIATVSV